MRNNSDRRSGKPRFSSKKNSSGGPSKKGSGDKRRESSKSRSGPKKERAFGRDDERGERKKFGGDRERSERKFDKPFKKFDGPKRERFGKKDDKSGKEGGSDERKFKKRDREFDRDKKFSDRDERPRKKHFDGDRKRDDDNFGVDQYARKKSFDRDDKRSGEKRFDRDKKYGDNKEKSYRRDDDRRDKKYGERDEKRSGEKRFDKDKKYGERRDKSFGKDERRSEKKHDDRSDKKSYSGDKKYSDRSGKKDAYKKRDNFEDSESLKKEFSQKDKPFTKIYKKSKPYTKHDHDAPLKEDDGLVRLNKYLSNSGICSRREADDLIKAGTVKVNGEVVTEMGYKIKPTDVVNYGGETLRKERKVYLILNKPKDYITTTDDPRERRTVMELIKNAGRERVYPVGRLDRNTVGLLLFTNDGELATKLMHPKFEVKKVYQVTLDKNFKSEDMKTLEEGVELEDGFIKPDEVSYTGETKREVGIEIHSGKNRIVRRIFEHLGYEVLKLDRVAYAGLTKKDLPRGKWRFLTEKEVAFLKMIRR